jgi:ribosomal silencing factor RsfS
LYLITWIEKITIKTDLKTEDIINLHSEIYELSSKKQVVANTQITKNITEKVFLDKLKNASETQQRVRREGFEFILLPEGDIVLKTKTQENKMMYNPIDKKYVDAKPASKLTTTKPPLTKKKR